MYHLIQLYRDIGHSKIKSLDDQHLLLQLIHRLLHVFRVMKEDQHYSLQQHNPEKIDHQKKAQR
jgi:hypothetical protein